MFVACLIIQKIIFFLSEGSDKTNQFLQISLFLPLKIIYTCLLVLALTLKSFANVVWNTNDHVRDNCVGLNSDLVHVSVGVFYDSNLKSEDK